ncbi:hypothetical protein DFJ58DRAFT_734905 [Suillus subalutaceus]|uniref:uncharacterized protein n=1 Tax=Suillus subalutaceus TaxID=48586 RepID=UPI001B863551|nr:uncharacterized protein DFJ58DRAFT_734905 [Suillus subalutaceus]KAG1836550.1 hypothetical protein DFJ58DRAFT_734905 [Suillus subalutaceus]
MSDLGPSNNNATNSSQTQPSLRGPAMRGASFESNTDELQLPQQDLAKRCLDVVRDFRATKGTKFEASYVISSIIKESLPIGSREDPTAIVAIYLAMLDQWESEQSQAAQRATGAVRERRSVKPASGSHIEEEPPTEDVRTQQASIEPEPSRPLSANLKHTIRIIQNWAQDQKQAKLKLMYHERSPDFYEYGWADIIAGRSLNLDAIHTIITTSCAIDKHTEAIGDVEFTYGVSEMALKNIATQGQWNAVWNRAAQALKFPFPFRQAELDTYSEHINEQFDQQSELSHGQVLWYNKAVRFRVGNSCKYELSNFKCFKDIYSAHFSAGGRMHNDTGESSKSSGGWESTVKREPCHKWNTGECTCSTATCRFAHVCNIEQDGQVCARHHVKAKHNEDTKSKST